METDNRLDGNAAGGILQAIFPFDMTMAEGVCVECGQRHLIGATIVYKHGMGTIIRCPACDAVLIRVAEINGRYWLDLHGMRALQLPAV